MNIRVAAMILLPVLLTSGCDRETARAYREHTANDFDAAAWTQNYLTGEQIGRYQITQAGGESFLLDTATGSNWMHVQVAWVPVFVAGLQKTPANSDDPLGIFDAPKPASAADKSSKTP